MKRKRIVVMYATLAVASFVALIVAVSAADASTRGIPGRVANCNVAWKLFFRGNVLTGTGAVRCTRPMKMLRGRVSLLRLKLGGTEELGTPSPQQSAHDDFFRTQVAYYQFQVSHVCQPTDVSYMWWLTIQTVAKEKAWSKVQVRSNFSHTLITDCG